MRRSTRFNRGLGDLLAGAIMLIVAILVVAMMVAIVQRQSITINAPPPNPPLPISVGGNPSVGTGYIILSPAPATAVCALSLINQSPITCVPRAIDGELNLTSIHLVKSGLLLIGTPLNTVPVAVEAPVIQLSVQPMINYTKPGSSTEFLVAIYATNNYSAYLPITSNWVTLSLSYQVDNNNAQNIPLMIDELMSPGSSIIITKTVTITAPSSTSSIVPVTFTVRESVLGAQVATTKVTAYLVIQ